MFYTVNDLKNMSVIESGKRLTLVRTRTRKLLPAEFIKEKGQLSKGQLATLRFHTGAIFFVASVGFAGVATAIFGGSPYPPLVVLTGALAAPISSYFRIPRLSSSWLRWRAARSIRKGDVSLEKMVKTEHEVIAKVHPNVAFRIREAMARIIRFSSQIDAVAATLSSTKRKSLDSDLTEALRLFATLVSIGENAQRAKYTLEVNALLFEAHGTNRKIAALTSSKLEPNRHRFKRSRLIDEYEDSKSFAVRALEDMKKQYSLQGLGRHKKASARRRPVHR